MDKPSHYIEARALPLDGSAPSGGDLAFVVSKLMDCVHGHIVDGHLVAVAFPEFAEEAVKNEDGSIATPRGPGSVVRIFGGIESLMAFIVRRDFAALIAGGACSTGAVPVKAVPEAGHWEVYSRSRVADKGGPGYLDRTERRLVKRIEAGVTDEKHYSIDERRKVMSGQARIPFPPYVQFQSRSTGQKFRLFVERKSVGGWMPSNPNSYGLSVPVPVF